MISDRDRGVRRLVLSCQCVVVTALLWAWFGLTTDSLPGRYRLSRCLVYNEFALLGLMTGTLMSRGEGGGRPPGLEAACQRSFVQVGLGLSYWLVYLSVSGEAEIPRRFLFSFIPLEYATLCASQGFLPPVLGRLTFRRGLCQKVLLVGPRRKAAEVRRWLEGNKHLGLEVLGLLSEDQDEAAKDPLPTLGRPADLEKILAAPGIVQVILVEIPETAGMMGRYTSLCEARGIRLLVVASLAEHLGERLAVFQDQGLFFIGTRREPLEDPINRLLKRGLDIAVSLPVVLFLVPPLYLAAWICQWLQSPGPVFFAQAREGFHNQSFLILKVRTMHEYQPASGRSPALTSHTRLYPIGSLLRRSSLDELPQFWNVLRGEMSVVGPRPHLTSYNDEYRRVFVRAYVRSFVKPGITGLAQVRGFRGPTSTPAEVVGRMESDIEYLENWSLWLDGWLIIRTAFQVLFPPRTAV